jgi:ketopantoate hydroxymethyltransferase
MDEAVKRLAKVYSNMDYDQRRAVREFIDGFEKKEFPDRQKINEELRKSLGPLMSGTCAYCGK